MSLSWWGGELFGVRLWDSSEDAVEQSSHLCDLLLAHVPPCPPLSASGSPWRDPAGSLDGEPGQKWPCLRTLRGEWGAVPCFHSCSIAGHFLGSSGNRVLLPKPSPILIQPTLCLKRALWDACLGTSHGPGPPRRTHSHSCLSLSGQVLCSPVCEAAGHVRVCKAMEGCTRMCSKLGFLSHLVRWKGVCLLCLHVKAVGDSRPGVQLPSPGAQPSWANAATCWPVRHVHVAGGGGAAALTAGGGHRHSSGVACSCQSLNRLELWWVPKY